MKIRNNDTEATKKEEVRQMFNSIASRYDLLNHMLSLNTDQRWRTRVVGLVKAAAPASILDIATGTGDLAIRLGREIPGAEVTGADISLEMLRIGRRKVKEAGLHIPMIECDAEELPFAPGSFDAVTVAFGVRNFGNLDKGLSEMHRMLGPGGRVYILEFSMPSGRNLTGKLYRFYFRRILPLVGRIVSGDKRAYSYLPESVETFPYGERFMEKLRHTGFGDVRAYPLMGGIATIYTGIKA